MEYSTNYVTSGTAAGSSQSSQAGPPRSLGSEEFMMLLLAQLRNQNPLEPMDDKAMMGQITQLNSLQELQKMSAAIQAQSRASQLTEAAGLIGKTVEMVGSDGNVYNGVVTGVALVQEKVMLWVGDTMVPLSAVVSVSAPEEGPTEPPDDDSGEGGV